MEAFFPRIWSKTPSGIWRLGLICETCESLFTVNPEDVSRVEQNISRDRGLPLQPGKSIIYYDVCCPVCGKQMSIDKKPPQPIGKEKELSLA